MSQFWRFLKRIFWRLVEIGAAIQVLAWFLGIDDIVRQWLLDHQILVSAGILIYIGWDFLMYGGKEAAYYEELKERTPRKRK